MTPIGELCTRLDELGIEHDDSIVGAVSWGNAEYEQYCDELTRLIVLHATPAQAIAATVGARKTTTRNGRYKTKYGRRVPLCECCGYSIGDDRYNFCPKCGAEIVGDE